MAETSFERDIKPLFRDRDIRSMRSWFDLSSYDDVRANADLILTRLEQGDMPCDSAWPSEQLELFRRWRDDGTPP